MAQIPSAARKSKIRDKQFPVLTDLIGVYKSAGYKIIDGIETVMIEEPNSTFRIFISRISHCLQFYYLAEPESVQELYINNLGSAAEVVKLEQQYKQKFG